MKKGLVLEGGAMRGMYTAGVIDVLMENGIEFDGAVGVSAGAVFGCNYKSRQIGRTIRYNKTYCRDKRYCSFRSLIKTGDIYGVEFCYHELPTKLDIFDIPTYRSNPMEFYATCTDAVTGEAIYHKCELGDGEDVDWLRASASMPMLSRIVEINGQFLSDGGTSDSVPLAFMEEKGYDRNVVVLTRPATYRKKKNRLMPIFHIGLRKYPKLIDALGDRHIRYNSNIDYIRQKEQEGNTFVIRPSAKLKVGPIEHNPDKLEATYQHGRKDALACLEELKKFLN